jgi:hypothetical protein
VLHLLVQVSSSLTVCFIIWERVLQQSGMLLLPWSSCGLQPLTHLVESRGIDLTACIPLAKYFQGRRLNWRHVIMVERCLPVPEAEPAYQKHDEERQENDPEELAQEEQRQQEPETVSKSPYHRNALFLSVYSHSRDNMHCSK